MKPGPELDRLVAEKVMGCKPIRGYAADGSDPHCGCTPLGPIGPWPHGGIYEGGGEYDGPRKQIKPYSTDIAAAWEVAEKAKLLLSVRDMSPDEFPAALWQEKSGCEWVYESPEGWSVRAATAPTAICLAALRAKGVDVEIDGEAGKP